MSDIGSASIYSWSLLNNSKPGWNQTLRILWNNRGTPGSLTANLHSTVQGITGRERLKLALYLKLKKRKLPQLDPDVLKKIWNNKKVPSVLGNCCRSSDKVCSDRCERFVWSYGSSSVKRNFFRNQFQSTDKMLQSRKSASKIQIVWSKFSYWI